MELNYVHTSMNSFELQPITFYVVFTIHERAICFVHARKHVQPAAFFRPLYIISKESVSSI